MEKPLCMTFTTAMKVAPSPIIATAPPKIAPRRIVGSAGVFKTSMAMTRNMGMRGSRPIWKWLANPAIYSLSVVGSYVPTEYRLPMMANITSVMIQAGIVLKHIERICPYNVPFAIAGARFVVSEKGDILSPKSAPHMTAPAIIPAGKPILRPIPIHARPAEAAEP